MNAAGEQRAPDLTEPVVGYRAWKVIGERLHSPYIPCRWDGRLMHAICSPAYRKVHRGIGWLTEPHRSPDPRCACGIYAYHRPGLRSYFGEFMWLEGIVTAWGRIEVHSEGLRAEHARIEALAEPAASEPTRSHAAHAIAARLEVPLVARERLLDVAADFGEPLPASMLPEGAQQVP
jgi:hypothetical protein